MIRQLTTLLIALVLGYAAVAADQVHQPLGPVLGFAGYEYDSSINGIEEDMKASGYTLIDRNDSALWYDTTFLGIACDLGYIFKNNALIGGVFILKSATEKDFAAVHTHLSEIYEVRSSIKIKENGIVVAVIDTPEGKITQILDINNEVHEVTYIHEE